ncbi:MAG: hypothetical protein ABIP94_24635 [Planctomycetota bacterium]
MLLPGPIGGISRQVARIGGLRGYYPNYYASDLVETVDATAALATTAPWVTGAGTIPKMHHPRFFGNVVMLPTGELFAVGGQNV